MNERTRSISTVEETPEMKALNELIVKCNEAHEANKKANNEYESVRKKLLKAMGDAKIRSYTAPNGDKYDAEVAASKVVTIDVTKLETHVAPKLIKPFLTITKGVVENKWGKEIAEDCTVTVDGNVNVSVKRTPFQPAQA